MALPARMKVKVEFVDQNNPRATKWVFLGRIGDCHSACEVTHQGEGAFFAVRELLNSELFAALVQDHTQWASSHLKAVKSGKKPFDGCSYRL